MRKVTISLTDELDAALSVLAMEKLDGNKSRAVEIFLRENPLVSKYVEQIRSEPDATVYAASGKSRRVANPAASS